MKKLLCIKCKNFVNENEITNLMLSVDEPVPICNSCAEELYDLMVTWIMTGERE